MLCARCAGVAVSTVKVACLHSRICVALSPRARTVLLDTQDPPIWLSSHCVGGPNLYPVHGSDDAVALEGVTAHVLEALVSHKVFAASSRLQ